MHGTTKLPLSTWILLIIVLIQWVFISFLLQYHHHVSTQQQQQQQQRRRRRQQNKEQEKSIIIPKRHEAKSDANENHGMVPVVVSSLATTNTDSNIHGVAASIIFRSPLWFSRRYGVMIHNVLMNIPSDWVLQLFVHRSFWYDEVLRIHPSIPRTLADHSHRIVISYLPDHLQNLKKQPNHYILLDPWFWNELLADRVLLFSGNGILCSNGNTNENWERLTGFDYVGVPTRITGGKNKKKSLDGGGDTSTHSYRNRTVMLQALAYAQDNHYPITAPQNTFFSTMLQKMNHENKAKTDNTRSFYKLATREIADMFGGVLLVDDDDKNKNATRPTKKKDIPFPPMVISGTQNHLPWQVRDDLLMVCPELKIIFPSLHEPACFGAHPEPDTCKNSICALKDDKLPSSGC